MTTIPRITITRHGAGWLTTCTCAHERWTPTRRAADACAGTRTRMQGGPMTTHWRDRAACLNHPGDFHHGRGTSINRTAHAKAICATCPVRDECMAFVMGLEDGISTYYRHGIWAGTTPDERAEIAKDQT